MIVWGLNVHAASIVDSTVVLFIISIAARARDDVDGRPRPRRGNEARAKEAREQVAG